MAVKRTIGFSEKAQLAARRSLPLVVWILAILAAVGWREPFSPLGTVVGYAETDCVPVIPPRMGIIRSVRVNLHDHVEAGQVLMEMDDRGERILLAAIQADLARLTAEVVAENAKLEMERSIGVTEATNEERRFLRDREMAQLEYLAALASEGEDRAELQGARIEFEIVSKLFEQDDAPFRELNTAKTTLNALQERVDRNKEVIERTKKSFEDADRRWYAFSLQPGIVIDSESVLTPLRLAIDVRQHELEDLVRQIDACVLRSPLGGQVTALSMHTGERVMEGDVLAVISPVAASLVVAYLPEDKCTTVSVGTPVTLFPVSPRANRHVRAGGTVVSMSAIVSEAPIRFRSMPAVPFWGREVIIALANPNSLLPGEALQVKLGALQ